MTTKRITQRQRLATIMVETSRLIREARSGEPFKATVPLARVRIACRVCKQLYSVVPSSISKDAGLCVVCLADEADPLCQKCEQPGSECACEPCGDFA